MTSAQELAVTDWAGFIGQDAMKKRLDIHIAAAREEVRPMEHALFSGPLGSGKSSLARLCADRLEGPLAKIPESDPYPFLELTMPMERKALLNAIDNFPGGVLFLDEIHALPKKDQEMLLTLLAEGYIQDAQGRLHVKRWLTVIAATTERDKVLPTLFSRFAIRPEWDPYTDEELGNIISRMARKVRLDFSPEMAVELGRAAGGIPRNGEQLVLAARALQATGNTVTTESILEFCVIDPDGLTQLHLRLLEILESQKGKAGLSTLVMLLRIPPEAVRDLERLLLERGLIIYTPGGREITAEGRRKLRNEVREYVRR